MTFNHYFLSPPAKPGTRRPLRFPVCLIVMLAWLILPVPAQAQGWLRSMKLLTPTTGWVSNDNHLYWTTDSGSHWKDIAPVPPGFIRAGVTLQGVFFLNTHEGWAAVYLPGKPMSLAPQPGHQNTLYDVAHTVDAGKTWSFSSFTFPQLSYDEEEALSGLGGLFFIDPLHGWMNVALTGNSQPGELVVTKDGGKTWTRANGVGDSGIVRFTSLKDGWLLGGPYSQLFATHDGCKTWKEVHITPPPQAGAGPDVTYEGLPVFEDSRHGFTAVFYVGGPGAQPKLVVYATNDGGRTWSPVKVVGEAEESGAGVLVPIDITDSIMIISKGKSADRLNLARIHLSGKLVSPIKFSAIAAPRMNFLNPSVGLALRGDGRLFYTFDGGATWKNVTPWPMPKPSPLPPGITVRHPKTEIVNKHLGPSKSSNQARPHKP